MSRATRADGTSTVYTLYDCDVQGWCTNGDPGSSGTGVDKLIIQAEERDASDGVVRDDFTHNDRFERTIVEHTQRLDGGFQQVGRQYDQLGHVYRETAPCDYAGCTAYWVTNTYDLLGRLVSQSRPQSDTVATPVTTTFAYEGRTQKVTDPNGKLTTKVLDVNGWMRQSKDHDNYSQYFSYDAAGSLTAVTDTASNPLFSASYSYGAKPLQDRHLRHGSGQLELQLQLPG